MKLQTSDAVCGVSKNDVSINFVTPLPVELINFTATKRNTEVELTWETASELNNDKFEIERSTDAKNWSVIGNKKGMGTTQSVNQYQFNDNSALTASTIYYRLRQVDFNGAFEYSNMVKVNNNITSTDAAWFNANTESFNINYLTAQAGSVQVIIINNQNGQVVLNTYQSVSNGKNGLIIDANNLKYGIYTIQTIQNQDSKTFKVAKF